MILGWGQGSLNYKGTIYKDYAFLSLPNNKRLFRDGSFVSKNNIINEQNNLCTHIR